MPTNFSQQFKGIGCSIHNDFLVILLTLDSFQKRLSSLYSNLKFAFVFLRNDSAPS